MRQNIANCLDKVKDDMEKLLGLIQHHVPRTTNTVWLSTNGEDRKKFRQKVEHARTFEVGTETLDINGMIAKTNNVLFTVLRPELMRDDTNLLPFLDLQGLSSGVVKSWNLDGGHMVPEWYDHVIAYIWQALCNSNSKY